MKKLLLLTLAGLMALFLCGCEPDYAVDTFYATEMLNDYGLAGLPVPKLENSRLRGDSLYLNLTQEEYETYVAGLVAYLRGREDVRHLSYRHSRTLMFGAFPMDICAPLPEDYDYTGDQHEFVFTYTEELHDGRLANPIRISVIRNSGTLFRTQFTYNTAIYLQPASSIPAELDYCAGEHTYDAGTVYPVPGLDRQITIYRCVHCGSTTQDTYLNVNYKEYSVTVTEGRNHIWGNNWSELPWDISGMFAGQEIEITTFIPEEGTMELLVNGESIPALRTEDDKVTFGFIMPEQDVQIQLRIVTGE